jgi:hypothetical protein
MSGIYYLFFMLGLKLVRTGAAMYAIYPRYNCADVEIAMIDSRQFFETRPLARYRPILRDANVNLCLGRFLQCTSQHVWAE